VDISALIQGKKKVFDGFLQTYLSGSDKSSGILEALSYSLAAGGKRFRPILTMLSCEALGGKAEEALPAGLAIEMIHTFSLIHDDLPALDNDDLRRGVPTCHAEFGEATAILAGDALIFQAFSVISSAPYPADVRLDILSFMSEACGTGGLIEGEHEDLLAEGRDLEVEEILEIYRKKTSRLFELCMYAGGRIAGPDAAGIDRLVAYGTSLGLAFQVIDDILDRTSDRETLGKSSGKDLLQDTATIVKALGMEKARSLAREMTDRAVSSISGLGNGAALEGLARWMLSRVM
jgi:geranylgeranyl diphosphate synthase type II